LREQVIKIVAFVILGMVIGYLLSSVLSKESPIISHVSVADTLYMESEPDTFWIHEPVTNTIVRTVYTDTGSTKIKYVTQEVGSSPGLIWSYEKFNHSKYVTSEVKALAPDSVNLFANSVVVEWQDFYDDNYKPQFEVKIKEREQSSLIKGLAAGAIATAGIATGEWEYALGGAAAAYGIIIIF
jgi:hypothetical protein